ncbi:uncharacterized protein BDR25DRAFT_87892 [Lindgomyces ingoldianus]|uniref:Uncharacterized protein n=1 Tax=Lindgomyces ingoldianus TaxID=673940 RepID=A0ACB6R937_9PLEO|nr:uncharacterized protein BDR25DRAFT_87892 [Lindgomyces ingoldianus]KAF2475696.1 hypothetical protein BDR25DRAFT_87892 [Lindgomyces ingoldianus]
MKKKPIERFPRLSNSGGGGTKTPPLMTSPSIGESIHLNHLEPTSTLICIKLFEALNSQPCQKAHRTKNLLKPCRYPNTVASPPTTSKIPRTVLHADRMCAPRKLPMRRCLSQALSPPLRFLHIIVSSFPPRPLPSRWAKEGKHGERLHPPPLDLEKKHLHRVGIAC